MNPFDTSFSEGGNHNPNKSIISDLEENKTYEMIEPLLPSQMTKTKQNSYVTKTT